MSEEQRKLYTTWVNWLKFSESLARTGMNAESTLINLLAELLWLEVRKFRCGRGW